MCVVYFLWFICFICFQPLRYLIVTLATIFHVLFHKLRFFMSYAFSYSFVLLQSIVFSPDSSLPSMLPSSFMHSLLSVTHIDEKSSLISPGNCHIHHEMKSRQCFPPEKITTSVASILPVNASQNHFFHCMVDTQ